MNGTRPNADASAMPPTRPSRRRCAWCRVRAGRTPGIRGVRAGGFTLLELIIVMVVLVILAGAGVAGYGQYVRHANRVDATAALLRIASAQERYYLQHGRYATTLNELGDPPPAGLGINGTERGLYALSLEADPAGAGVGYRATARVRPDGAQGNDTACYSFSVDQSGRRLAADAEGRSTPSISERCWG